MHHTASHHLLEFCWFHKTMLFVPKRGSYMVVEDWGHLWRSYVW